MAARGVGLHLFYFVKDFPEPAQALDAKYVHMLCYLSNEVIVEPIMEEVNLMLCLKVGRNALQVEEILETQSYRPSELEEALETTWYSLFLLSVFGTGALWSNSVSTHLHL